MNVENVKKIALEEEVLKAIKEGVLTKRLSVLRMKAVEAKMSNEEFAELVENCKSKSKTNALSEKLVSNNKTAIWIGAIVLIAIEWFLLFNPHPQEGESTHIILTLIANFITMFVYVIAIAAFIRKKK